MYLRENPVLQRELLTNLRMSRAFVLLFLYVALLGGMVFLAWPKAQRLDLGHPSEAKRLVNLFPNGTTMSSFDYKLDATGTRTRVVEVSGDVVSWGYDKTYQLIKELRSGVNAYAVTYIYDSAGNRLRKLDSGVPTT